MVRCRKTDLCISAFRSVGRRFPVVCSAARDDRLELSWETIDLSYRGGSRRVAEACGRARKPRPMVSPLRSSADLGEFSGKHGHPNLRKRPRTPAKGRGAVQRAIKRAFAATSASALTSTQIYDWAHVRRRLGRRKSMPFGVYSRTLRTLKVMCYRVGRGTSIGRPWLWRLRNTADD
jgi:hypothetical protein